MRERAPPRDRAQQLDLPQRREELTKGMPYRGDGLRSKLSDGSVDCSKDILRSAVDRLREHLQTNATEPTVREPH